MKKMILLFSMIRQVLYVSTVNFFLINIKSSSDWWMLRQRITQSNNRFIIKIRRDMYLSYLKKHSSSIHLSTKISEKPTFPHGLNGIFISKKATIGSGATIFQQVTIGSNILSGSKSYGAPIIGDNVYIGAGAKIIGGVTIGNNVRIGANCIVTQNIPDNSTVVMQKPRIIIKDTIQNNTFVPIYKSKNI